MVYLESSQEWLTQAAALLEARPTTCRITSKYNIKPAKSRPTKKQAAKQQEAGGADTQMADTKPPRARLILKAYDPASATTLKYKTTKAAEVSRLIQMLGALGRKMAALPDVQMADEIKEEPTAGTATPPVGAPSAGAGGQAPAQQPGAGGGKGKKKKGKR